MTRSMKCKCSQCVIVMKIWNEKEDEFWDDYQ